jgi:signal peptidase I
MFEKEKKEKTLEKKFKQTSFLGKAWYFIWYDDSILSWLVNIILAYVLIKFIFYPVLGLAMGTTYPIVAVVSTSMEHTSQFDQWWQDNEDYYLSRNITKEGFEKFPLRDGFNKGDLMILVGKKPQDIKLGDVIVYQSRKPYPIIHRVIGETNNGMYVFQTKGDNNRAQIRDFELDETHVLQSIVYGKAVIRVPWLGYVKIWFVSLLGMAGIHTS